MRMADALLQMIVRHVYDDAMTFVVFCCLLRHPMTETHLATETRAHVADVRACLAALLRDGLIQTCVSLPRHQQRYEVNRSKSLEAVVRRWDRMIQLHRRDTRQKTWRLDGESSEGEAFACGCGLVMSTLECFDQLRNGKEPTCPSCNGTMHMRSPSPQYEDDGTEGELLRLSEMLQSALSECVETK